MCLPKEEPETAALLAVEWQPCRILLEGDRGRQGRLAHTGSLVYSLGLHGAHCHAWLLTDPDKQPKQQGHCQAQPRPPETARSRSQSSCERPAALRPMLPSPCSLSHFGVLVPECCVLGGLLYVSSQESLFGKVLNLTLSGHSGNLMLWRLLSTDKHKARNSLGGICPKQTQTV